MKHIKVFQRETLLIIQTCEHATLKQEEEGNSILVVILDQQSKNVFKTETN